MASGLSRDQIERYDHDGFVHPIRVMSAAEARKARAGFEELEILRKNAVLRGICRGGRGR